MRSVKCELSVGEEKYDLKQFQEIRRTPNLSRIPISKARLSIGSIDRQLCTNVLEASI